MCVCVRNSVCVCVCVCACVCVCVCVCVGEWVGGEPRARVELLQAVGCAVEGKAILRGVYAHVCVCVCACACVWEGGSVGGCRCTECARHDVEGFGGWFFFWQAVHGCALLPVCWWVGWLV